MPDEVQQGACSYPGIPGFESVTYSIQHGRTPGRIVATTRFPPFAAPTFGTFTLTDGQRVIQVGDCKYQRQETEVGDGGRLWTMHFLDRAWRWQFGKISGRYNLRDTRGNLKPNTIRTPKELMELCLKAMGEKKWDVYAPDGLAEEETAGVTNPAPGQQTPPTNTNPEVIWDGILPVDALLALCDQFGLRFCRCPIRDIVVIRRAGDGAALPYTDRFIDVTDGLENLATPTGVGVIGAAAMIQMVLKLVPVGLEWDGRYVPIDELSYRPNRQPQVGKWSITFAAAPGNPTGPFAPDVTINGVQVNEHQYATLGDLAAGIAAQINAYPTLTGKVYATAAGATVTVAGTAVGEVVTIAVGSTSATAVTTCVQVPYRSSWDGTTPGTFWDVQATDRLSYEEARRLAVASVFSCYRVADDDISNGWKTTDRPKKIVVPYYGEIDYRDQLVLLTEMVEQVKPTAPNPDQIDPTTGLPANLEPYTGYSRGREPVVYGSVSNTCIGRWFVAGGGQKNTAAGSRVAPTFVLDPVLQVVTFPGGPVFKERQYGTDREVMPVAANLALETAVNVLENKTRGLLRYLRWVEFGKPASSSPGDQDTKTEIDLSKYGIKKVKPFVRKLPRRRENVVATDKPKDGIEWHSHDDDVLGVIGQYTYDAGPDRWRLTGRKIGPDDVSDKVGDYYLIGHLLEHTLEDAQTARYRGIELIQLDGAVQMVSWSVGPGGVITTASRNQGHGVNVLPYPARRREENLAANPERAAVNARSGFGSRTATAVSGAVVGAVNYVAKLFK